jgi:hypothetical protein
LGFFSFSQLILCRDDTDPIKVEFALLTQVVQSSLEECGRVVAFNSHKLCRSLLGSLQSIRQHVAHMQDRLIIVELDRSGGLLLVYFRDFRLLLSFLGFEFPLHCSFIILKGLLKSFFHSDERYGCWLLRLLRWWIWKTSRFFAFHFWKTSLSCCHCEGLFNVLLEIGGGFS